MHFKRTLIILALALAGCGNKVNTSTPEAYAKSIEKISADLSPEKKTELRDALIALAFDTVEPDKSMFAQADITAPGFVVAGDKINGKTADEIIRAGYETRIKTLDSQIAQDAGSAKRMKAERAKYAAVFDNVHIDGARYHVDKNMFSEDPLISFTVTNGAKMAVKRIYLHGILSSPGRSVPWVSDDINYEFPGGLEPGESKALDLAPNMFGEWKVDDTYSKRPDLNLALTLTNIEGADGTKLVADDAASEGDKVAAAAAKQKLRNDLAAKLAKL